MRDVAKEKQLGEFSTDPGSQKCEYRRMGKNLIDLKKTMHNEGETRETGL
ncbi:MAG: hypothetical protein JWL59_3347 [Chthoniobacteraceae bacterium]|nr:hypothetical protein [Chthoniobacteraceae bacterium]